MVLAVTSPQESAIRPATCASTSFTRAAEGAAQELIAGQLPGEAKDKSGNAKLKDVGIFLRDRIIAHFRERGREATRPDGNACPTCRAA